MGKCAAEPRAPTAVPHTVNAPRSALVLFSGGQDSTACLAYALDHYAHVETVGFDYGQRHAVELECARDLARTYGAKSHRVVRLDLPVPEASALTDATRPVPRNALGDEEIPATYVPARNTLFLAHALAWAEAAGARDIVLGANALDYSGYPDCRPEFIEAFEMLANLATKAGVEGAGFRVHAPLLRMSKADIVHEGLRLGVDFGQTVSCYQADAQGRACGHCDACRLRAEGFAAAGIDDPTRYLA